MKLADKEFEALPRQIKPVPDKQCEICGKNFPRKFSNKRYCFPCGIERRKRLSKLRRKQLKLRRKREQDNHQQPTKELKPIAEIKPKQVGPRGDIERLEFNQEVMQRDIIRIKNYLGKIIDHLKILV